MTEALAVIDERFPELFSGGGAAETMLTIKENLGNDTISPFDLPRLKVPAGGVQSWEVEILGETESVKEIRGVILSTAINRSFWKDSFESSDGSSPPDCVSGDGLTGSGTPGGDCMSCPFNEYGSATGSDGSQGRGKACKEQRVMYILQENDVFPTILVIPPTSLNPAKKYLLDLAKSGRLLGATAGGATYDQVVTSFRLSKEDKGGFPTSVVQFGVAKDGDDRLVLSEEQVAHVRELSGALSAVFATFAAEAPQPESVSDDEDDIEFGEDED